MQKTYKILSLLLSYPNEEIHDLLPIAETILRDERILDDDSIEGVKEFINFFSSRTLVQWQEHYVQLFDYSKGASLYLFEHLHGDSKDRGQAMVDLIDLYSMAGLQIGKSELPDYLPVFLEFLSLQSSEKAAGYLAEIVNIIGFIHKKLAAKENPFHHLVNAVIKLSSRKPDENTIDSMLTSLVDVNLDESYEEKPVTFGCDNF
jgi:nitrate reductase delta subunit